MIGLIPAEFWDYGLRDLSRGLVAALGTAEQQNSLHIDEIGQCVATRSGRAAIVVAIKALNLSPGARIGVPLYCCPVVFKAVEAAGCSPCFIDVDPATYCMDADDLFAKRSHVDAVIPVHMFGNVCDVPRIQEAIGEKPVIEDCAQSLGSTLGSRTVGSFGTISMFSFRSGKYLSVGEGGAVFSARAEMGSRLVELVSTLPAPTKIEELVHVAKTYLRSQLRSRPLYGVVGQQLWSMYNRSVDYSAKSPLVLSKIFRADLDNAKARLLTLGAAIERQRAHASYYLTALDFEPSMLCAEKPGTYYNRYLFPIMLPSTQLRAALASDLHRRKIGTTMPYSDIADVAAKNYGYLGDCPAAEQVAKRVLAIPSYHTLTDVEVSRIAENVNAAWASTSRPT